MGNRAIIGRFIQLVRPFAKRPRFRPQEAFDAVRNPLLAERDRWPLWLPVLLGCGIGGYFALPFEPWAWSGLVGFALCAICGLGLRNRPVGLVIALAGGTMAAGFAAAQWASAMAAAPVIGKETAAVMVSGRVISVESRVGGQRVVLEDVAVDRSEGQPPRRVRLRLGASAEVWPGNRIRVRAVLMPPQQPALPGGFDFARQAWFDSLGGVGYAVGRVETVAVVEELSWTGRLGFAIADLRRTVTLRMTAAIPGPAGAVAAALTTGERGAIPEGLLNAYRDSGLAHLLSISGLHMSLVVGFAFFVLRAGLALVEPLALSRPIKKWAAAGALAAGAFYLLLAGAPVPTQRAFLMAAVVLLAVMVDRNPISLRLVGWSAFAVLLWQPQALLGASFQMSFAAVVALVAAYERLGSALVARRGDDRGWLRRIAIYAAGVALTTLIAGSATAVFGLYHFNRAATYGLVANLLAVPITGFWVMPSALTALLAMPFGLDAWPLTAMGLGVAAVNAVAAMVAGWPGAAIAVPPMPLAGLIAFTFGGLWLCLWRGAWRWWGAAGMILGLLSIGSVEPPDILADGEGDLIAVRAADGRLLLAAGRGDRFQKDAWGRYAGSGLPPVQPSADGSTEDGRLRCDSLGCIYGIGGQTAALVRDPGALGEDCAAATVVVSVVPVRRRCQGPRVVIDRFDLWRHGAHAVWLRPDGPEVQTVAQWQGRRPWSPARPE